MPVSQDPIVSLLGFIGVIVLLLVLITKFRWHVFLALLVPILLFGLLPGIDIPAFIAAFEKGFGNTLSNIGVVIILGSIMAEAMKHTGAVERITLSMINLIGRKRMPFALTLTGFVLGIAIFADVAYVIVNPLVHAAALELGVSMGAMATGLVGALQLTHAVVPPTPGPLAAAAVLDADLGLVILFGAITCFFGALASWGWGQTVGRRIESPPSREFVGTSFHETGREAELPSTLSAYLPIAIPIALIAGQSAVRLLWRGDNFATGALKYLGWPVVALSLGLWLAMRYARGEQRKDAVTGWVKNGLTTSAMIFAVTGLGGSLSEILKQTPAVDFVAEAVVGAGVPTLFLPFLLGVLVNMITGSSTVGVITAASLTAPILPGLGLSPEAAVIAAASGSIIIKYVNSSYFWVVTSLSGMKADRAVLAYGGASLVGGLGSFAALFVLWQFGVL